jgi:plasmid stability protein
MASITLKNIPDDLHRELKEQAESTGRSLNQEALRWLRVAASLRPQSAAEVAAHLADLRELHRRQRAAGVWLTDTALEQHKGEGRS